MAGNIQKSGLLNFCTPVKEFPTEDTERKELRLFIKKNIPNQTTSYGLIKISHLGKNGFLKRNFSTERMAVF
ncbi:MAG: hypothetical protein AB7S75_22900, partial [Desulfococcaceae bacterium]